MGIDINSSQVKGLGLTEGQLKNLDAIEDGTGQGSIAQSIFDAAQAYKSGEFKEGTETRESWEQKLGDKFKAVLDALTHVIQKNASGEVTKEISDRDADGIMDTVREYNKDGTSQERYDANNDNIADVNAKLNKDGKAIETEVDTNSDGYIDTVGTKSGDDFQVHSLHPYQLKMDIE